MMITRCAFAVLSLAASATAAITCGPNTAFSMGGASAVANVAKAWANGYKAACGNTITVTSATGTAGGGSIAGARQVCGVGGTTVDIGLLSRQLISPDEAVQNIKNPYLYTCAVGQTSRQLTEVQAAIDGLAFIAAPGSVAANCISSLVGQGLTFSQIRYMYSSFTLSKLKADPFFDPSAVPNSDGNDNTRLWSELCSGKGCNCPATPIAVAGAPTSSGTFAFFSEKILTGTGETVTSSYQSDPNDSDSYVVNLVTAGANTATVGYSLFAAYNNNVKILYAATVQDPDDYVWRAPTFAQFQTGEYPASFFLYMEVAGSILSTVQNFFVYAYSPAGQTAVLGTGILPIPTIAGYQMLSRLGANGGVALTGFKCGPSGSIFQGGSSTVYPLAYLWSNVYADACGLQVKTISGGSTLGAQLACGIPDPVSKAIADVGTLSRKFGSTEAVVLPNGYDFQCLIGSKRKVRQFPVAIDGITFAFPKGQAAANCIASLPGNGLTIDQLRWMYSSYGYSQLVANGWNPASVPGYTAATTDKHLWSYLGGSGCPATEIAYAGSPSSSGTFSFFTGVVFTGSGETIALTRTNGVNYYNVPEDNPNEVVQYLQITPASIGYFGYSYYQANQDTLGAVPIKNGSGNYVAPSEATFGDGTYNPFTRQVFMQLTTVFLTFQKTVAYVNFGITTSVGDALTRYSGLTPLSATTKAQFVTQNLYKLNLPCFSEAATVQVLDKGVTAMKDLKIGDMVMNANGKYDAVYSFGHYQPDVEAEFVQIHAAGLKSPLEISREHMLFVNGAAVPASAVVVGDRVNLAGTDVGAVAVVKKIQSVVRHGAYAPFTTSGTIAVNNVAASVYVDLHNKAGVLVVGDYQTPISMQFLAHMFQASHRLVCMMSPAYCQTETYNAQGVSSWVAGPLALTEWAIQQNAVVMILVFTPCFLFGVSVYAMELMLSSKLLLLLVGAMTVLAIRSAKRKATNKKEA